MGSFAMKSDGFGAYTNSGYCRSASYEEELQKVENELFEEALQKWPDLAARRDEIVANQIKKQAEKKKAKQSKAKQSVVGYTKEGPRHHQPPLHWDYFGTKCWSVIHDEEPFSGEPTEVTEGVLGIRIGWAVGELREVYERIHYSGGGEEYLSKSNPKALEVFYLPKTHHIGFYVNKEFKSFKINNQLTCMRYTQEYYPGEYFPYTRIINPETSSQAHFFTIGLSKEHGHPDYRNFYLRLAFQDDYNRWAFRSRLNHCIQRVMMTTTTVDECKRQLEKYPDLYKVVHLPFETQE